MIVALTEVAEADIEAIGDFIANQNSRRAVDFVDEMRASSLSLADNPRAFPVAPRYRTKDGRRRVHGNYPIDYQIRRETIVILRALHGALGD